MHLLYNFSIWLLTVAFQLAAYFHPKAKKWVEGRQNWELRYRTAFKKKGKLLWVHVASLGEFEQGRPIIEAFRKEHPEWQIVLTFFSPSGYEVRKDYPHADFVGYLPADSPKNARTFLDLFQPDIALFIKYEFWANYLFELKQRSIPTLLISALFRQSQPFFKFYGSLWRQMLTCFQHIFVQDKPSATLLQQLGVHDVTVAGDTRVDRVLQLAEQAKKNTIVEDFLSTDSSDTLQKGLIVGSSWEEDEAVFLSLLDMEAFQHLRWVIAPHEPSQKHLDQLLPRLNKALRYSACLSTPSRLNGQKDRSSAASVLVIDNIGMLNTLYRYGWVAYIGGGFGKGIHNTLEPAAFGLPIIFGPKYKNFEEARQFVARGAAFPVENSDELVTIIKKLSQPAFYQNASHAVSAYLAESRGATEQVIQYLSKYS